ncbi:TRAP transporter fused permease subunit [Rhodobacteraceae bacterium D3-12]|nr:TRAP transporter fused permease subunit [Rhodobacteraceae bacterium D3-12]
MLFALLSVGFHMFLVYSGLIPALVSRPIHFMLALPWIFFLLPQNTRFDRISAPVFFLIGLVGAGWIMLGHSDITRQYGSTRGTWQLWATGGLILVTLEMARRAIQWVLPLVALIVLIYGAFGHLLSGDFGHAGLPVDYFLGTLVLTEAGLWSELTGISAEVIAPFIILGAFISAGTAGTGFMAVATQVAGRFRAGVAKIAIISSALYGSLSGVAAANTASTGIVTIPAMIRLGYPRSLAAATEAVASTGGQIMPPLMGASVFIMAELLTIPYTTIMVAATLPAILFFATAWIAVHQYGIKYDLKGIDRKDLPGWGFVARTLPFFVVPMGILIYCLAFTSYTAPYSAFFAIFTMIALLLLDSTGRMSLSRWVHRMWLAIEDAATQIAKITAIICCAALIVGVFSMTGLGVKITSLVLSVSGENLWLALALTGLAALILGMELPTPAAYVICVAVAGPALVELGLEPLYAHLFVFWYALLCTITPPVCGNVFIAAGIAQTPWLGVAFRSMSIGVGLFLVPMAFIANPSLLLLGSQPAFAFLAMVKILIGLTFFSFGVVGTKPNILLRIASVALGFVVIFFFGV